MRVSFYKLLFMLFILFFVIVNGDVAAVGCHGDNCRGLNPQTMQCPVSEYTQKSINGGIIETRRSSDCEAKWARTTNTSGYNRYIGASIYFGCQDYCYNYSVVSPGLISNEQKVYTGMVPWIATPVRSCGRVNQSNFYPPVDKIDAYCTGAS